MTDTVPDRQASCKQWHQLSSSPSWPPLFLSPAWLLLLASSPWPSILLLPPRPWSIQCNTNQIPDFTWFFTHRILLTGQLSSSFLSTTQLWFLILWWLHYHTPGFSHHHHYDPIFLWSPIQPEFNRYSTQSNFTIHSRPLLLSPSRSWSTNQLMHLTSPYHESVTPMAPHSYYHVASLIYSRPLLLPL